MVESNSENSRSPSGCFGNMKEMMRKMLSNKGGWCCPCMESMNRPTEKSSETGSNEASKPARSDQNNQGEFKTSL